MHWVCSSLVVGPDHGDLYLALAWHNEGKQESEPAVAPELVIRAHIEVAWEAAFVDVEDKGLGHRADS